MKRADRGIEMQDVLINHEVKDYAVWKQTFDSAAKRRSSFTLICSKRALARGDAHR